MIDISHINVGDKVKVTRTNGDSAEFVVTSIAGPEHPTRWMDGEYDEVTVNDDIESIEVVSRPLPTEPGFYQSERWDTDRDPLSRSLGYHLSTFGEWHVIYSSGAKDRRTAEQIEGPLVRLVPEVTP